MHRRLLLLPWIGLSACAVPGLPPLDRPPREALSMLGEVEPQDPSRPAQVVVIADRHPVFGRLGRDSGPLSEVRRENATAVRWLVEKGFDLLGCEYARGPLPRQGPAEDHRRLYARLRRSGARIDQYNLYQPIRFELEFSDRLVVEGVEDPELYAADVAALEGIREITRHLETLDFEASAEIREGLQRERDRLLMEIRSHNEARGRAAANNLLAAMDKHRTDSAILMIGSAHVPAALEAFAEAGRNALVFRCQSFHEGRAPELALR